MYLQGSGFFEPLDCPGYIFAADIGFPRDGLHALFRK
jgi:hypothetical protein